MYIKLRNNNVLKKKKANNKPLELTEVKMGGAIAAAQQPKMMITHYGGAIRKPIKLKL